MPALVRSLRRLGPSHLTAFAFVLAACATAQEPEVEDDGGGNTTSVGGSGGTAGAGGSVTSSGGKGVIVTGGLPGTTAGTGSVPSGGKASGTAGTPAAGGTGTGTAGTATGTGGTSPSTCPPYTGTLGAAATSDSVIFQGGFGTSKGATPWTGYGYTYTYGTATITPGMGNNCFANKKMCASGSVPASDSSGAGIGWNIKQASGATTKDKVAVTTPVKVTLAGFKTGMRVSLSASSAVSYCHTLTAAEAMGTAIPLTGFAKDCWETMPLSPYDGTPIEAIQVVVPGSAMATAATAFDFCIIDIEPG